MMDIEQIVKQVVIEVKKAAKEKNQSLDIGIQAGVSNRHIHLSEPDLKILFGENAGLTHKNELTQPGQFAAEECVTLVGPKGCIERVRVLGPVRLQTQVEILASDCYKLGIKAPVRESGKLAGTPGIAVIGTMGCVQLKEGVIIAQRHIHMTYKDAEKFSCCNGEIVSIAFNGIRGGLLDNVIVRVSDKAKLDFHLDVDEANCLGIKNKDIIKIKNK
jgi:putative phosphotransacetylase